MIFTLPEYLSQGEPARLFPVLSTTSKEGRTTSIVLACLAKVREFGCELVSSLGQKTGARSQIETFTEVVFKSEKTQNQDRPDGLIIVKNGAREWRALVETKVGNSHLAAEQIERYRSIAKENGIDCVVTISNQFATTPSAHPLPEVLKSRSKVPVFHWSWMHILTHADLLLNNHGVVDTDQRVVLNELRRFLSHESAGVKGFDRMPPEWSELNKTVASGGSISVKSPAALEVVHAWHQETRDLSLILSRMTETPVTERMPRKLKAAPEERTKDALITLKDTKTLNTEFDIVDAAAPLQVTADITARTVFVGMTLRAPEDRVSTRARTNWLLKQIKEENVEDVYVRLHWPGKAEPTQYSVAELRDDPSLSETDREGRAAHSFFVFSAKRLGGRFAQQTNFIADLENIVPTFYGQIGARLSAWVKRPPRIKQDKTHPEDVAVDAISDSAQAFEA